MWLRCFLLYLASLSSRLFCGSLKVSWSTQPRAARGLAAGLLGLWVWKPLRIPLEIPGDRLALEGSRNEAHMQAGSVLVDTFTHLSFPAVRRPPEPSPVF